MVGNMKMKMALYGGWQFMTNQELISIQNIIEDYMNKQHFVWGMYVIFKRNILGTLKIYSPRPEDFNQGFDKYKDRIITKGLAKKVKILKMR